MKIVTRLLVLLPLLWVEGGWAEDCPSRNYNLDSQAKVDALGATSCDRVSGDLVIWNSSDITNLDSLINITSVGGRLRIHKNTALTNLNGLANITVGSNVFIIQNTALTNIDGLASLTSVSIMDISANDALTNLDGLASLTSVGNGLHISGNDALTNLNGLASLTSVGVSLMIKNHRSLTSCEGVAPLLGWPTGGGGVDAVGGTIEISNNRPGCNSAEEILASVSGPTQPVINQATTSSTSISLAFTPSTATTTAFPVTSHEATCTSVAADLSEAPASALLDNVPVSRTLTAPSGFISSVEIDMRITHFATAQLYITLTTPQGTELVLWNRYWNPFTTKPNLVGTFPTTLTPVDTLSGIAGQTMEGDWVLYVEDVVVGALVHEGVLNSWGIRITEELAGSGSGSPIEVLGATRGRDYTCTVAPVSKLGTTPVSDPYTVSVPLELPSVPTITSTDYQDGAIILTVSVSDDGGTDITGYEATCTDGTNNFTGTSSSSPITVSGLTNDVAYTCTVTATNSVGTSSASAATAPITPEELTTGLPIWLLYQATQ